MPKLKTHSGAKKRFKLSKNGKVIRAHANKSHILNKKTTKRKRGLRKTTVADKTNVVAVKKLIPYKRVSGVVGDVDKTGRHGLVALLHQKVLPWSSDELSVGLPNGLNGKENTRLIIEAALLQKQKVEAAEYCSTYALDGVKAGEAFLASELEMSRICDNYSLVNMALRQIKGADPLLNYRGYWTSSERSSGKALSASMPDAISNNVVGKWAKLCVCPVIAF